MSLSLFEKTTKELKIKSKSVFLISNRNKLNKFCVFYKIIKQEKKIQQNKSILFFKLKSMFSWRLFCAFCFMCFWADASLSRCFHDCEGIFKKTLINFNGLWKFEFSNTLRLRSPLYKNQYSSKLL